MTELRALLAQAVAGQQDLGLNSGDVAPYPDESDTPPDDVAVDLIELADEALPSHPILSTFARP